MSRATLWPTRAKAQRLMDTAELYLAAGNARITAEACPACQAATDKSSTADPAP
jgi:hypothetical protein